MELAERRLSAKADESAFVPLFGDFLTVIVPCFNEVDTVETLLAGLRTALPGAQILVIDDGSTDGSGHVVSALRDHLNLDVVQINRRSGKGAAIRAGLPLASRDWVVIQDADLEYDAGDLRRLLAVAQANPGCAVYGSRYLQRGRAPQGSISHYLAVKVLAILAAILYRRYLTDPHTCYKLVPARLLCDLQLQSNGFEICAEINSKLLARSIPIIEVPISYRPRSTAAGKKIRAGDFFHAAKTYIRHRIVTGTQPAAPAERPDATQTQSLAYLTTRFLIGALLVLGGGVKLAPWRELALLPWLVLPPAAVFAAGLYEFILGCFVLSFAGRRSIAAITGITFASYLVLLLLQLWAGESACQCLGSRSLPLVWMLGLDSVLLASICWYRQRWQKPLDPPEHRTAVRDVLANMRVALPLLVLVGIALFGSLDGAIGYATGARLLTTATTQHVGYLDDGEVGTATFELANHGREPIRILGAKSTCRCVALDDLPMTIEPGQRGRIRVRVKARGSHQQTLQRESATLIFDDPTRAATLTVTAIVSPTP
jgi:dolichol-phosphate mannosyltransferase